MGYEHLLPQVPAMQVFKNLLTAKEYDCRSCPDNHDRNQQVIEPIHSAPRALAKSLG
jgi:hypothetical protein